MIVTATALSLGFLHGLGADHLMAIAALASACVYLYRDKRASDEARIVTLGEVLPLVRDLLAFLKRR